MTDITSRIHWLAFTMYGPARDAFIIYDALFKDTFGPMEPLKHGGRGFQLIYKNVLEFKIYVEPISGDRKYFHYEIPGSACDCIPWDYYQALSILLESNYENNYKFTRLDYAFDNVPFEPQQVKDAVIKNQVRTLAKRESLQIHESPFSERDDQELGTYTVELGSRTSERMIRVYNKRGFTRLELELKDNRADLIAKQLLSQTSERNWFTIAQAHLLDYVDFKTDWWEEFKNGNKRADVTISDPAKVNFDKTMRWLTKQVSPSLSVAYEILPHDQIDMMLEWGKRHRGDKFDLLLATYSDPNAFDGKGPWEGKGSHQSGGDEE